MKTTKALIFCLAIAAGSTPLLAQDNLHMRLSDGSVLTGYISSQRPGVDLTVTSSKAVISLPDSAVLSIFDEEIPFDRLSPEWQKWGEDNNAFKGNGQNRSLILSTVSTTTGSASKVRVLERGASVKYLELAPNSRPIRWEMIEHISADRRPQLLLSGINRTYKLFDGSEIKGQYVEEIPGDKIVLLGEDGVNRSVRTDRINRDTRTGLNASQSLFEQSDLVDIVMTDNGGSYRGVIFEKNYDEKDPDKDYIMIMLQGGHPQSISSKNVVEYRKERNPDYRPVTDIRLGDKEGAVNRMVGEFRKVNVANGFLSFRVDSVPVAVKPAGAVTEISVEAAGSEVQAAQWRMVKVRRIKDKKDKDYTYGFSFEDLIVSPINPKAILTSANGVTRLDYSLSGTGLFGLYQPDEKRILLFYISNDMKAPNKPAES